uniref:Multicomponent Na+:H+ antiporter subunit B n=1 Tax=Candidatus Kentrum eta TaxID=2126337 RepID=A0A450UPS6_9GAMM|nr:MAG: multicomponent Na+:H+ antiporter subunit B [Candidatus Kentron sp. H]VFJ95543.1 MAG: multicomponent Na+:H+ antiporter subunit B [Candidatus Kentron sp. H]VFK01779.1 MAG: multicomponent Na+:H+ antiporter subunit B [Candidatus Kentron sp. H]
MITGFALLRVRNLFAVVMLTGLYSLLSAALFVVLDAVDVAFTEAAVGAGVASILMLSTLARTGGEQHLSHDDSRLALIVVLVTGMALLYGTLDMPYYGDPNAPAHQHVAPFYLEESGEAIGIPNVVTSVLASYRGYDTLGEVTVIFTAGIGVMALLMYGMGGAGRASRKQGEPKANRRNS